ncbi:AraC family transcriptional regulator [Paenibacillus tepidiphilus]|uniref:AraC family transcriptional regulator n=1 Tax=Paenibacillus tepidiphilus TaxID=2608683 RepID=UPI00123C0BCB|nr:AraC family transcriptional regulator [Paenibacillus tepidiphilus]
MKAYYEHRKYPEDLPVRMYKHEENSFFFHAHWHSDIELVWVQEGVIRMGINREIVTLEAGGLAVCCSGDIHFYDSTGMQSTVFILVFRPSVIGHHGNWPDNIRFRSSFITPDFLTQQGCDLAILTRMQGIMEEIYGEMTRCEPYYQMFVRSKVMELCGICQRSLPGIPIDPVRENKRISRLKMMQDILHFLEISYSQPLTLEETARRFNLSTFHFCRLFQSLTGTHFNQYLNTIRVRAAEEQLRSTDNTVTHIALECGYANVRTFNRAFKAIKGVTPSSLRK